MPQFPRAVRCIIFTFFLGIFLSNAQNPLDKQIEVLIERSSQFAQFPDSIDHYGDQILQKARPSDHLRGMIKGYILKGYAQYRKGEMDQSIIYCDSALLYKEQGLKDEYTNMMQVLINRATSYGRKGVGDSAQAGFMRVRDIAMANQDFENVALAYNSLGIGEKNRSNFTEAIRYYEQALHLWDSLGSDAKKPSVLMNIGIAQSGLDNPKQASKSFHEGLRIAKRSNNVTDEYRIYNNLSVNHNVLKQYDSARFYLQKIIPHYKSRNLKRGEYLAYQNVGRTFMNENQQDSAVYYFKKAGAGFKATNNEMGACDLLLLMGDSYLQKKQYSTAIRYLDSSVVISKRLNLQNKQKGAFELLATAHEASGNYKRSNAYLKDVKKIEDQLLKAENAKNLSEIITKHQVKEKDKTIDGLNSDKAFYQSTTFTVLIVLVILALFIFLLVKRNSDSKKELEVLRKEIKTFGKQDSSPASLLHLKSKAVLKTDQLQYIKSDGHYLEYFSEGNAKPEIDRDTLKSCIEHLQSKGFAQIHKSYVVNLKYIRIINSTKIMLEDGTWLPLSRTYKPILKEILLSKPPTQNK